ncbi:hypothetical protein BH09VER1_BH09VER1_41660 [soil metagenome]
MAIWQLSMRAIIYPLFAIGLLSQSLLAGDLKPYDRLSKLFIPMTAEVGASGATLKGEGAVGVSTTKDFTSAKEVILKVAAGNAAEVKIEAFGVYKGYDSKKMRFEKIDVQKISNQQYSFTLSTKKTVERVKFQQQVTDSTGRSYTQTVDTGRAVNHGEKILGWFARAIVQDQIVGIAASSTQLEAAAGRPNPVPE